MEVGDKVYTATVFGGDRPYVHFAERTVSAILPTGFVVEAKNHPTIVLKEDELFATKAEAAASAIDKLRGLMADSIEKFLDEIQKIEKSHLQRTAAAV
jgi:hypothetical protein